MKMRYACCKSKGRLVFFGWKRGRYDCKAFVVSILFYSRWYPQHLSITIELSKHCFKTRLKTEFVVDKGAKLQHTKQKYKIQKSSAWNILHCSAWEEKCVSWTPHETPDVMPHRVQAEYLAVTADNNASVWGRIFNIYKHTNDFFQG